MDFIREEDIDRLLGKLIKEGEQHTKTKHTLNTRTTFNSHSLHQSTHNIQQNQHIKTIKQNNIPAYQFYKNPSYTRIQKTAISQLTSISTKTTLNSTTGLITRISAFFTDLTIIALFETSLVIALYFTLGKENMQKIFFYFVSNSQTMPSDIILLYIISLFIASFTFLSFIYFSIFESIFAKTPGKALFRIQIVDKIKNSRPSFFTLLLRSVAFFSFLPLVIFGFKIHDYITNTKVVNE